MNQPKNQAPCVPSAEILFQVFAIFYQPAVFRAALELQVFARVAAGEDTADALAAATQVNSHEQP